MTNKVQQTSDQAGEHSITFLRRLLSRLFRRRTNWDGLDYGKPATTKDELSRLNGER